MLGCWFTGKLCCFNVSDILNKKAYINYIFLFSPRRYAFPGLVTVTSHLCWTQNNRLGGQSKPLAVPAVVVLLRTVAVLLARFRSRGLPRCILPGDAPSPHASSLRSPGPVCACECKWIPAAACWDGVEASRGADAACLCAGRSQLQTVGSPQRWFAAGVLLRGHQDLLRHVPARTEYHR